MDIASDDVRRWVQQDTCAPRDRPLHRIRNIVRVGAENLTDRQRDWLNSAFTAHEQHVEVEAAWRCAQPEIGCARGHTPRGHPQRPSDESLGNPGIRLRLPCVGSSFLNRQPNSDKGES